VEKLGFNGQLNRSRPNNLFLQGVFRQTWEAIHRRLPLRKADDLSSSLETSRFGLETIKAVYSQ
jgi:hypothetical protein